MFPLNETHAAHLTSWVASANDAQTDFPIQNLPFGVFRAEGVARVGVAIGDAILDVSAAQRAGLYDGGAEEAARACAENSLVRLMQLGNASWSALRAQTSRLLRADTEPGTRAQALAAHLLIPMSQAEMQMPVMIRDYTDFTASIYHATNAGSLLHPENPLHPNYKYVPIGYHGRASSVVLSGTPIRRPRGQRKAPEAPAPTFGLSQRMDYELELAFYVGRGNALGEPIPLDEAENYLFGVCLLNDWSARDVQGWEMQPLGPFLGKNFGTLISPWVITMEALAPFRVPAPARPAGDPAPLPYLDSARDQQSGGLDMSLEIFYST
ncbi:MAG TPA: fumarylacetoacetate hydrolase family protein, partial [Anaerolineales bacterium]|nr:fumarylacetoacetate hydrolase family protein [Anaerolineales bacterium]